MNILHTCFALIVLLEYQTINSVRKKNKKLLNNKTKQNKDKRQK